jgi:DNA-binding GntR family transcriptional regulator
MEYRYIRWVDDLPWSVSFAAIPALLAPPDWDGADSLFAAMSAAHGVLVRRDERCFSAVPANPEDAAWLEVQVEAPLLCYREPTATNRARPSPGSSTASAVTGPSTPCASLTEVGTGDSAIMADAQAEVTVAA